MDFSPLHGRLVLHDYRSSPPLGSECVCIWRTTFRIGHQHEVVVDSGRGGFEGHLRGGVTYTAKSFPTSTGVLRRGWHESPMGVGWAASLRRTNAVRTRQICWQAGRGKYGWKPGTAPSPMSDHCYCPLTGRWVLSMHQTIGPSHSDDCENLEVHQFVAPRMEISNLALYPKPPVEMDAAQGDSHRSESTPPRKVMEMFTVQPRSLRKGRGLPTRTAALTGDPNPGHCRGAPQEGPDTGDGIATVLSVH